MTKLFVAYFTGVSQVEVGSEVSCHGALRLEQFTTVWTLLVDGAVSQEVCTKTTLLHKTFSADSAHVSSLALMIIEMPQEPTATSEGFAAVGTTPLTV